MDMWKIIARFVEKLNASPSCIRNLECFKLACSTGLASVGLTQQGTLDKDEIVTTMTQAAKDEEIDNPKWIETVEKMMIAYENKVALDNYMPNFDLFGDANNMQVCDFKTIVLNAEIGNVV